MLNPEKCWRAVLERDRSQDGRFFFGVTTTGVFCLPSCAARRPLRKNVRFFRTAEDAQSEGLRPCRRCRPLERGTDGRVDRIREICEHIRAHSDSGDPLTLEVLSRESGLSPSQLRHQFREILGVTPRQYVEACRFQALRKELRAGDSVTAAIYDAGFASSSRVYEQVDERLGMTPGEYRAGGKDVAISYALTDTPVGLMIVAATDRGLCFVQFGESQGELLKLLRQEFPAARIEERRSEGSSEQLELWLKALRRHLGGAEPHLDLPLDVRASAFRHRVWRYLQSIPYGETRSYSQVAAALGQPTAVRAVAGACAANRTAIVVPCHRVIRAGGGLGGYRWGQERKKRLLELERSAAPVARPATSGGPAMS